MMEHQNTLEILEALGQIPKEMLVDDELAPDTDGNECIERSHPITSFKPRENHRSILVDQIAQAAYQAPDHLISPFTKDAFAEPNSRLDEHAILKSSYEGAGVEVNGECEELIEEALTIAKQCGVKFSIDYKFFDSDGSIITTGQDATVLEAGVVGWHHDNNASWHNKRMLIAFPGVEGFVLHIAHASCDDYPKRDDFNKAVAADPSRMIRKSIPLTRGLVIFLDVSVYHSVTFEGDLSKGERLPANVFFDFGLE